MTSNLWRLPDRAMTTENLDITNPSLWAVKPWWCQPWSIVLTGVTIPAASWLVLHRWWITVPLVGVILLWWLLFLVIVPGQYAAMLKAAEMKGD